MNIKSTFILFLNLFLIQPFILAQCYRGNCTNGIGTYIWGDSIIYNGTWKKGKPNGVGRFDYMSGKVYEGEVKNGVYQGKGILGFSIGFLDTDAINPSFSYLDKWAVRFEGTFDKGKPEGKGELHYFNVDDKSISILGIWKNQILEGEARVFIRPLKVLFDNDESKLDQNIYAFFQGGVANIPILSSNVSIDKELNLYLGEFPSNSNQYEGILWTFDFKRYQGQFVNYSKNGYGILSKGHLNPETENYVTIYDGIWQNDQPHGQGKKYYFNGQIFYEGVFNRGVREGFGTLNNITSELYWGNWKNDLPNGPGIGVINDSLSSIKDFLKNKHLSIYNGNWRKGVPHGSGEIKSGDSLQISGNWVNGSLEGEGILTYKNYFNYQGKFSKNAIAEGRFFTFKDPVIYLQDSSLNQIIDNCLSVNRVVIPKQKRLFSGRNFTTHSFFISVGFGQDTSKTNAYFKSLKEKGLSPFLKEIPNVISYEDTIHSLYTFRYQDTIINSNPFSPKQVGEVDTTYSSKIDSIYRPISVIQLDTVDYPRVIFFNFTINDIGQYRSAKRFFSHLDKETSILFINNNFRWQNISEEWQLKEFDIVVHENEPGFSQDLQQFYDPQISVRMSRSGSSHSSSENPSPLADNNFNLSNKSTLIKVANEFPNITPSQFMSIEEIVPIKSIHSIDYLDTLIFRSLKDCGFASPKYYRLPYKTNGYAIATNFNIYDFDECKIEKKSSIPLLMQFKMLQNMGLDRFIDLFKNGFQDINNKFQIGIAFWVSDNFSNIDRIEKEKLNPVTQISRRSVFGPSNYITRPKDIKVEKDWEARIYFFEFDLSQSGKRFNDFTEERCGGMDYIKALGLDTSFKNNLKVNLFQLASQGNSDENENP